MFVVMFFFFKQKTAYEMRISDWSSDVCSSDLEWYYFPDQQTALNALMAGEVDYFEQPAVDLAPILESNPDITLEVNDPLGNIGFARFNHLLPPFDNPEICRAALMAMNQEDYMAAAIGDPK